jgi:predicted acylesterase/phospholipase RssA
MDMSVKTRRPRSAADAATKTINLALQGGGAHGAFAWGVLDRLIEDGRIGFEGISATSAGAMNAAVLATDGPGAAATARASRSPASGARCPRPGRGTARTGRSHGPLTWAISRWTIPRGTSSWTWPRACSRRTS